MKRMLIVVLAVLALVVGMAVPAFAGTSVDVTITAQPAYIVVTQAVATWTLNGIDGDGVTPKNYVVPNTSYYANPTGANGDGAVPSDPVVEGECYFDLVTTGSSLPLSLTVNCGNFTGGGAIMGNSGTGSNGAATFGGYSYCEGMTYSSGKVVMAETGSTAMKTSLSPSASFHWGAVIKTRSNAWTVAGNSTATMTLTATATP